jgi:hypothetical protein
LLIALSAPWLFAAHAAPAASDSATAGLAVPLEVEAWRMHYLAANQRRGSPPMHYVADTAQFLVGSLHDRPMSALLFTLERVPGGSDWTQLVALFWVRDAHYLFCCVQPVAAAGSRLISGLAFSGDYLTLQGNTYGPGDAACCPSRPVTLRYALAHRRLVPWRDAR